MSLSRRDFIKQAAAVSAAGAISMKIPESALAQAEVTEKDWTWDKSVCRFCGTDCHLPEDAAEVGATPVPASHLYDMRRDKQLDTLNAANYYCTLCHAPQANTGELVENTFEPYYRAKAQKERSNLLDILNQGVE